MKKPSIFPRFVALFAVSTVVFSAFAAAAAELPLRVTGEGAEELRPRLQTVYLRLVRLFRLAPRRPVAVLEISLSPAVPADSPEYRVLDASHHLLVCNLAGEFFSLPAAARRRLYGAMLLTLVPNPKNRPPDFLPGWFSLGLDQVLASRETGERWVRTNRLLPVLRGLAGYGRFPAFAALASLAENPAEPDPAAAEWIGEMARCRFFLMRKDFFTPAGIGEFLNGRRALADFPEEECTETLRNLAWNDMHPRPGELAVAAFAPLATVEYPEVDAEGKPTGKMLRCKLELVGAALRKHPNRDAIMARIFDGYIRTSRCDARKIRRAAELLAFRVRELMEHDNGEEGPDRKLADALRELGRAIDEQRAFDAMLDRMAAEHTPLADAFRLRFRTVRRPSPLAAPEVERFLSDFARRDSR